MPKVLNAADRGSSRSANLHPVQGARVHSNRWSAAVWVLLLSGQAATASEAARQVVGGNPLRETRVTFAELGAGSISLQGVQSTAGLDLGIRKDEVVVSAVLHLRLTYSPALIPDLSHLRLTFNGQTLAAITLTRADAGHEVERSINLDPRYFSDYNHLQLDLISHYTSECEDPQHSSLWARISRDSDLTLTLRALDLRDDLALLPAPFFDQHDNRRLVLPIVLPANPSRHRALSRTRGLLVRHARRLPQRALSGELRFPAHAAHAGVCHQQRTASAARPACGAGADGERPRSPDESFPQGARLPGQG